MQQPQANLILFDFRMVETIPSVDKVMRQTKVTLRWESKQSHNFKIKHW